VLRGVTGGSKNKQIRTNSMLSYDNKQAISSLERERKFLTMEYHSK
jgi:hypothetical protein